MYTDISLGPKNDQGMRVNCFVGLCTNVRIKSHQNIGFSIAEIEVYTLGYCTYWNVDINCADSILISLKPNQLASGNPEEAVMIHHGCSESMEVYDKFIMTSIKECLNVCGKNYDFAGIKVNTMSHCIYSTPSSFVVSRAFKREASQSFVKLLWPVDFLVIKNFSNSNWSHY